MTAWEVRRQNDLVYVERDVQLDQSFLTAFTQEDLDQISCRAANFALCYCLVSNATSFFVVSITNIHHN